MRGSSAVTQRSPSPDDVLQYLCADYRLRAGLDPEVDAGQELRPSTTIADWQATCDLVSTDDLAPLMNAWCGTARPAADWRAVLNPPDRRTLGDLAAFVATHARWTDYAPMAIAGVADPAAGVFFTLRGLLAREQVSVAELRPSTDLQVITRRHPYELGRAVATLAPGLVPVPVIVHLPRQRLGGVLLAVGVFLFLGGVLWTAVWPTLVSGAILVLGLILRRGAPVAVTFGPYRTIGDLVRAIVRARQAAA